MKRKTVFFADGHVAELTPRQFEARKAYLKRRDKAFYDGLASRFNGSSKEKK